MKKFKVVKETSHAIQNRLGNHEILSVYGIQKMTHYKD
jgi:hypothetical protein